MARKTLLWLCIICLDVSVVVAQGSEDSLRALIHRSKQAHDLWEAQSFTAQLAFIFIRKGQLDSAKKYYLQNLSQEPKGDEKFRANVLLGLGTIYHSKDQFDSAIHFYRKSISTLETVDDTETSVIAMANLSDALKNVGLYEEALSVAFQLLSTIENEKPTIALGSCYNNIGSIYRYIGNYKESNLHYRKALSIRLKINQPLEVAKSYNNLGELFILTNQLDSAKHNLTLAAAMKRTLDDKQGLARTLTRLGRVLMLKAEPIEAESLLKESLATQRQIADAVGMIETLNNLGELYLNKNDLRSCAGTLTEANTLIRRSGTPEHLRQNLELKVQLAKKQKDFANGVILLEELIIIRDSLLNEEKSKSLQAMQIRYETQKKEQEIALLQQREEINRARIQSNRILIGALIGGLILFAAIGLLIYINLKNARAAKERFELLLSETRHRIKNNLQTLASIFHLQTRHYTDQEMVLEARSSESRVHTMSLLHERFYSSEANHIVGTREYITDLVHKLVDIYGVQTRALKLSLNIDDVELDIDKALALSLIIQELVCNAFKYAFVDEPRPELSVRLRTIGDDVITTIRDNGIGFSGHCDSSQGLNLVDALVAQLDGDIKVNNEGGTTFIIRFPTISVWKRPVFS